MLCATITLNDDATMNTAPFADLDRLNTLTRDALAFYGLREAAYRLISYSNNAIYHVDTDTESFALRIHRPGLKPRVWIDSELAWLKAMRDEIALPVPRPVGGIYTGHLGGWEGPVYVDLFEWVDGHPVPAELLTLAQVRDIGAFAARLHEYSARFSPPPGFERPRLDWEGLFGERSPYHPGPAGEALFSPDQRRIIASVTGHIRETMAALGADRHFRLIHADLIPKNLLWQGESLAALDFDDCAYGHTLYDLAPALLFFKSLPDYLDRFAALWQGYTAFQPLPESYQTHLEALIAGRYIASIRWVAGNTANPAIKGRAPEIIAARVADLARYLDQGKLELSHYPH
jgi:Ser/Thr protein kinase RdoA (MazF antagonist)